MSNAIPLNIKKGPFTITKVREAPPPTICPYKGCEFVVAGNPKKRGLTLLKHQFDHHDMRRCHMCKTYLPDKKFIKNHCMNETGQCKTRKQMSRERREWLSAT